MILDLFGDCGLLGDEMKKDSLFYVLIHSLHPEHTFCLEPSETFTASLRDLLLKQSSLEKHQLQVQKAKLNEIALKENNSNKNSNTTTNTAAAADKTSSSAESSKKKNVAEKSNGEEKIDAQYWRLSIVERLRRARERNDKQAKGGRMQRKGFWDF
jgi:hypothetical protein